MLTLTPTLTCSHPHSHTHTHIHRFLDKWPGALPAGIAGRLKLHYPELASISDKGIQATLLNKNASNMAIDEKNVFSITHKEKEYTINSVYLLLDPFEDNMEMVSLVSVCTCNCSTLQRIC